MKSAYRQPRHDVTHRSNQIGAISEVKTLHVNHVLQLNELFFLSREQCLNFNSYQDLLSILISKRVLTEKPQEYANNSFLFLFPTILPMRRPYIYTKFKLKQI